MTNILSILYFVAFQAQFLAMFASNNQIALPNVYSLDPQFLLPDSLSSKDDFELKAKDHREAASRLNECQSIYSITNFQIKPAPDAIYSTKVSLILKNLILFFFYNFTHTLTGFSWRRSMGHEQ